MSASKAPPMEEVVRMPNPRRANLKRDLAIERERVRMLREDLLRAGTELAALYAAVKSAGIETDGLTDISGTRVCPLAVEEAQLDEYFRQVDVNYQGFTNPFHHYEQLVDLLARNSKVSIVPCCDLDRSRSSGVTVSLRHDIDADPVTAIRMARRLARDGICGSFYLLHTALYYGRFFGTLFVRHRELRPWIDQFLVAGCELGLHNDALGAHERLGVDGPAAMVQEIEWLRSLGATIRGTAGHNSAPVLGAENSEVFESRVLWAMEGHPRNALPLGTLEESALGLEYEGTFAKAKRKPDAASANAFAADRASADIRSPEWMKTYLTDNPCLDWSVDMQVWMVGQGHWVAGGRIDGEPYFRDRLTLEDLPTVMDDLPGASSCLFVLHPEYFRA
jgi:hypothetical protein